METWTGSLHALPALHDGWSNFNHWKVSHILMLIAAHISGAHRAPQVTCNTSQKSQGCYLRLHNIPQALVKDPYSGVPSCEWVSQLMGVCQLILNISAAAAGSMPADLLIGAYMRSIAGRCSRLGLRLSAPVRALRPFAILASCHHRVMEHGHLLAFKARNPGC